MRNNKSVLVTGASGFLGSHIVKAFVDEGWKVYAALRESSDPWRLKVLVQESSQLYFTNFDLINKESILDSFIKNSPDVVIHCAAYGVDYRQQDFNQAIATNITVTAQIVECAKKAGVDRFIHIGTCYEYGNHEGLISENSTLRPQGIYGSTKAAGTLIALERSESLGLSLTVIRPFGIYGPLEGNHKFVPQVIHACTSKSFIKLTPGEQLRDYTYVEDVADACTILSEKIPFPSGEIFNIGSGEKLTIRAFGETIADLVGNGQDSLKWNSLSYRTDEVMSILPDISKAKIMLGWYRKTALEEGILKTINYFKEH